MGQYAARRLLEFIPVLMLVSIIVFLMVRMIPGDPAAVLLGPTAKPEQLVGMRASMGLDKPIWMQYSIWVGRMFSGDFGKSFINDFPVSKLVLKKLPATVQLAMAALIVALAISIPVGVVSALKQGHWPDHVATIFNSLALGVPSFWLGILLILVFALKLKILPPGGYVSVFDDPLKWVKMVVMPSFTLGVYISAIFARFIRSSILETIHQDYVRTAYSKGVPGRLVISRHVLKNALIPLVTVFGLQFGGLLGGAVVIEYIFDWPGVGNLLIHSILTRDYSIVQAVIIIAVSVYLLVNLSADMLYGVIDPRIRRR
jgi:peptide/nickel transport system permease protein